MSKTRLSTGTHPSPQLERLATLHPFVQQIDIVVPSRTVQHLHPLTSLETTYLTAQFTLSEIYDYASRIATPDVTFKAIPITVQRAVDDTWCIDPRGVLTLCVSKNLYEQLGLVGMKLAFKGIPERYIIRVPLKRETTSVTMQARQRAALEIWDRVRTSEGLGRWRVAYVADPFPSVSMSASASADNPEGHATTDVTVRVRHDPDVYVPYVGDLTQSTDEATEDYQERLEALFEWAGMACLGAQRLRANDRVDPWVAVYETPAPASVDDVTHLRWRGLLDSTFVRSVVDTATSILAMSQADGEKTPFVSITLHSNLVTPVSYLPESPTKEAPARASSLDAEDTVCLMLSKSSSTTSFAIAQTIGKWDARWG